MACLLDTDILLRLMNRNDPEHRIMRGDDFNWLVEHGEELYRQDAGKWIAVRDSKVIGSGKTATEAAEEAEKTAPDGDFILEALDREADVIYGCL
ncbi:MAG: hypothetical protein HY718_13735 [Planctomycetes bacterium]|nr:hypothetical protein [Planctomycetota bacterium]